jgi:hypothetical protein
MADAPKVTLLEMIVQCEQRVEELDGWERVLRAEGKTLGPGQAREREIHRQMGRTLELVLQFQPQFVRLVKDARARQDEQMAALPKAKPAAPEPDPPPDGSGDLELSGDTTA